MKLKYKLPLAIAGALMAAATVGLFGIRQLDGAAETYADVIAGG